jgi:hypothetical protein
MSRSIGRRRLLGVLTVAALSAPPVGYAQLITSVTDLNSDPAVVNGATSQRENDLASVVVPFGEDVFTHTDRTHQYNGPRFTAAGVLTNADPPAGDDVTVGLPAYLIGGEYVSTMQGNVDNATFRLNVTVGPKVTAYLLIDNRIGDADFRDPPRLGPGIMGWVADDGWQQVNTGLSPNGQPDYAACDEGDAVTDFTLRAPNAAIQGTGPGVLINNFYTVYRKDFDAGATIELKEQNHTSALMYGLVVTPRASCDLAIPGQTLAGGPVGVHPPAAGRVISNTGSVSTSYTVEEWDPLAVPPAAVNYPWFSVDKAGATIAAGDADTLTISFDASGLPAGVYNGYLRFTDGCGRTSLQKVTMTLGVITHVNVANSMAPITNGPAVQRENDWGGVVVPFGEDVFCYTDRTHQYNGVRFTSAGVLTFADTPAAGDFTRTPGMPAYLLGGEYVSTRNDSKGVATYRLYATVSQKATAYLLIDNRTGDNVNLDPSNLGPASAGWVAADGWRQMNTAFSPNGQPDYVGIDEGNNIAAGNFLTDRVPSTTGNQGVGPGSLVNNAFTIYRKDFETGETIVLKQSDSITGNNYGLVVTPRAACDLSIPGETLAVGLPDGTSPAPIAHAIMNVGTNNAPVNYTVQEWNPVANTAADYAWLSLDKSGATVPGGGSDLLTLSFDATGLPAARYVGYLKFTDGCGRTSFHKVTLAIGAITYVSAFNGDTPPANGAVGSGQGPLAQRENDFGYPYPGHVPAPEPPGVVGFGAGAFAYTDRNHKWVGARFDPATGLLTGSNAANILKPGIPPYLIGGEYVSTRNDHRNNGSFLLNVTVAADVAAYLLIDNRVGEGTQVNTDPPRLGAGGNTNMAWVINDGWVPLDTGFSPNRASDGSRQPDYVGMDEGGTMPNGGNGQPDYDQRPNYTNGLSATQDPNNYFTVYKKTFSAGSTIVLRAQNDNTGSSTNDNMYGLVVVPQVPCRLSVVPASTSTTGLQLGANPASVALTISNTGVAGNPTTYTVAELDENKVPMDVGWLSVDKPVGTPVGPIPGGGSDTLTVSFDLTGLEVRTYTAYLRITDGCSPAKTIFHKITLEVQPPDLRIPQRLAPNGLYVQVVKKPDGSNFTWDEARVDYTARFKNTPPLLKGVPGEWAKITDVYEGVIVGSIDAGDLWGPGTDADVVSTLDGFDLATLGTSEGNFRWLDGTALPAGFPWGAGEPNNAGGGTGNAGEDCLELRADGYWNDDDGGPSLEQGTSLDAYYLLYRGVDLSGQGKFVVQQRFGTTAAFDPNNPAAGQAEAIALLKGPAQPNDAKKEYYALSLGDPGSLTGGSDGIRSGWLDWPKAPWPVDDPVVQPPTADDGYNDFVIRATAGVVIPAAGTYTFAIAHDDDVMFTLGKQEDIGGPCDPGQGPCVQQIFPGWTPPPTASYVVITFDQPGTYPIEIIHREGAGGSFLQLFAAPGDVTAAPYHQLFRLVGDVLGGGLAIVSPADACGAVFADRDQDGDVDHVDFGRFQACLTGPFGQVALECECFDRDGDLAAGDGDIDLQDLQAFDKCWTGPGIPWSQAITPGCVPERP